MALKVYWTTKAKGGLVRVIEYLEENWTRQEILNLENKIDRTLNLVKANPEIFPKSKKHSTIHKAIVDKNNYFSYRLNNSRDRIEITSFRGTKQRIKH